MSQPAHKLRDGALQVTIWRNPGEKGNWYSSFPAAATRKAMPGRRPKASVPTTCSPCRSCSSQAHSWIVEAKKADAKARKASPRLLNPARVKNPLRQPPEPGAGGRTPCPPASIFNHHIKGDCYDLHSMHT